MADRTSKVHYEFKTKGTASADWSVRHFSLDESLSRPYACQLELAINGDFQDIDSLLGDSCILSVKDDPLDRRLCGIINHVQHRGSEDAKTRLLIDIRPALDGLSYREDAYIFQNKTAVEILHEVLEENLKPFGRSAKFQLQRDYPKREYCVQYRETDLQFVMRLMEEEGITFYFDHSGQQEQLVLVDDNSKYSACETLDGKPVMIYAAEGGGSTVSWVSDFEWRREVRPTSAVLRDFDWTRPRLKVAPESREKDHRGVDRELYRPSGYLTFSKYDSGERRYGSDDGTARAKLLRESYKVQEKSGSGSGAIITFMPGRVFELKGHSHLDGKYLLTAVSHSGADEYLNSFHCVPAGVSFRPERITPRPTIAGVQTALVVGPAGEEVHTDEHGRIKVQFHWDRFGKNNETSSCWIRVAQTLAGTGWGSVFIPRIGMEVLIDFLEGNPDRPLVVGCLYNGENPTPYKLPDDKTKIILRTSSSPGGNGYNELTFEDAAGSEQVYLQAQKNLKILVKNDKAQEIKANEKLEVKANRDRDVGGNQTLHVAKDDSTTVDANQSLSVGKDRKTSVGGSRSSDIGAAESLSVGKSYTIDVTDGMSTSVGKDKSVSVTKNYSEDTGANKSVSVKDASTLDVGGNRTETIGKDHSISVGANFTLNVSKNIQVSAEKDYALSAKKIVLNAEDSLTLKAGDASIEMKKNGDITIKGKNLKLTADSDVVIKGSKVTQN